MARTFTPIRLDIWGDADFAQLSPAAQHLYFALSTSPNLSYCGVIDWRPKRFATLARGWTAQGVTRAADELSRGLFLVVDEDTEEALIRSFVKHDGLLKNPKTAVSMTIAYAATTSHKLRGVMVHELVKLRRNQPEMSGWKDPKVADLLRRPAVDPATLPLGLRDGLTQGQGEDYPQGLGERLREAQQVSHPEGLGERLGNRFLPEPEPLTINQGGYVTRERHQTSENPEKPPQKQIDPQNPRCPDHAHIPATERGPACRACAAVRQQLPAPPAPTSADDAAAAQRAQRRAAIAECGMCDEQGIRIEPRELWELELPAMKCDHTTILGIDEWRAQEKQYTHDDLRTENTHA